MIFPLVFLAGFIDAIAGGGGLISLPAYFAAGLPAHLALGTNKFSAVLGTGISTARFAKNGSIKWEPAFFSFAGALLGSAAGARIALLISERRIAMLMLFIVPAVAVLMLRGRGFRESENHFPRIKTNVYAALIGLAIGAYDGFFGPGTGTFLIMAFTSVLGLPLLTACGNAKAVNFASNIAAVVTFALNDSIDYKIGFPCVFCAVAGNYAGAGIALKKGTKLVRPMLFVVIVLLMLKIIWDLASGGIE